MFLLLLLLLLSSSTSPSASKQCTPATSPLPYAKCLTLPTQDASISFTYLPSNSTLHLSFTGSFISPSGWVAVGLNPSSPSMSGTRALISFPSPSSPSSLLLLPFLLTPSTKLQLSPLLSHPLHPPFLSPSASLLPSSQIRISFSLPLPPNRSLIHLIWNRGLYVQSLSPTIHPTSPSDLASRASINLLSSSLSPPQTTPLRSAHASLNAITWGLLIPAGAICARHLPRTGPSWFRIHAGLQLLGVAVGALGFGFGVVIGSGGYVLHKGLGYAVMAGGGMQAGAVFCRPGIGDRMRKYWKSYHHLVGYGVVVVGVVNVFEGMEVMGLGGSYGKLAYCLGLGTLAGVCVALEVNGWVVFWRRVAKEEEEKGGGVNLMVRGSSSSSSSTTRVV